MKFRKGEQNLFAKAQTKEVLEFVENLLQFNFLLALLLLLEYNRFYSELCSTGSCKFFNHLFMCKKVPSVSWFFQGFQFFQ